MKQFEITFCAPPKDKKRMFIARALAEGETAYEAAPKAYEALKEKYPDIKREEWLGVQAYSSLELSIAIELPCPQGGQPTS